MTTLLRTYTQLMKPGIIMGNLITTVGGFALAARGNIEIWLLLATALGISLIVGSACVFNNYIDREIDRKMTRTKKRALALELITPLNALVFGACLGLIGASILFLYTNILTLLVALLGFFVYVALYSFWKYRSSWGTIIGSVAGAVPPVVGYCAVSNHLDAAAYILFLTVALWQMPHFYAIAIYRFEDYVAAALPVLPIKRGLLAAKIQMVVYIVAFMGAASLLTVFGYTGYAYLIGINLLGLTWLALAIPGFTTSNDQLWARKMFIFSLVIITAFCVMISIDNNHPIS